MAAEGIKVIRLGRTKGIDGKKGGLREQKGDEGKRNTNKQRRMVERNRGQPF